MKAMRMKLVLLLAFLGLIAAACGSGTADSAVATASDAASADDAATSGDADDTAASDSEESSDEGDASSDDGDDNDDAGEETFAESMENYYSPIAEALGQDTAIAFDEESFAEQEREAQIKIRECMLAEGFEYDIVDQSGMMMMGAFPGEDMTQAEYTETYGFGFSTMFEENFGGPDMDDMPEDPNQARVEAMSEGERDAYFAALHGSDPFEGFDFDEETGQPIDPETGEPVNMNEFFETYEATGCQSEAYEDIMGPFGPGSGGLDEDLETGMMDLYENIEADPRIVAANDSWSECMGEAGYSYGSIQDVFDDLQSKMEPFYGGFGPMSGSGVEMDEETFNAMTEEEQNAFMEEMSATPVLDEEQKAALAEVNEFEIEVATASLDCQGTIEDVYDEVRIELEEKFVSENQAAFDAARVAAGN